MRRPINMPWWLTTLLILVCLLIVAVAVGVEALVLWGALLLIGVPIHVTFWKVVGLLVLINMAVATLRGLFRGSK